MLTWLKRLWHYLIEKVSITITPSPKHKVRVFAIRRIIPVILVLVTLVTIGVLASLYKYYAYNYYQVKTKLIALQGVKSENQRLKREIFALNQDTERLKQNLYELMEYNEEIKNMIKLDQQEAKSNVEKELKLELKTLSFYNEQILFQGLPIGGGSYHFYLNNPDKIIEKTRKNIKVIRENIPKQKKDMSRLETSVKRYNNLLSSTPSIWPLADGGESYISSNFGWRVDPVSGKQEFHEGLDIGVWYNTPVMATAEGVVKYAGWMAGYGRVVKISHGFGYETRYGHLHKIKVKKGQKVERGQVIALSGNSGKSTGPHLHYEVRINNIPQDPREYIGR